MVRIRVLRGYARLLERWRFRALLGLLLVIIFVQPMMHGGEIQRALIAILLAAVFHGTIHVTREVSGLPPLAHGAAGLWLVIVLLSIATESRALDFVAVGVSVLVGMLVTWCTFAALFREAKADADALGGAVFGFFLLAVVWAELFRAIEIVEPGAFLLASEAAPHSEFLYFSLVTITTLGYGDFLPVAPVARILTGVEAGFGTLYIAILIGRIVGAFKMPGR